MDAVFIVEESTFILLNPLFFFSGFGQDTRSKIKNMFEKYAGGGRGLK